MTKKREQAGKRNKDKNKELSPCEYGRCRNFTESYEARLGKNLNIEYK